MIRRSKLWIGCRRSFTTQYITKGWLLIISLRPMLRSFTARTYLRSRIKYSKHDMVWPASFSANNLFTCSPTAKKNERVVNDLEEQKERLSQIKAEYDQLQSSAVSYHFSAAWTFTQGLLGPSRENSESSWFPRERPSEVPRRSSTI